MTATHGWLAPTAIPTTTAKITYAVSCVSRTTVLKRTMESAPTRLKARAILSPMTCVTIAIRIVSNTSVMLKEDTTSSRGRVRRYTNATAAPKTMATTRRTSTCTGSTTAPANVSVMNSGIGGRARLGEPERLHGETVLRDRFRLQPEFLDQL